MASVWKSLATAAAAAAVTAGIAYVLVTMDERKDEARRGAVLLRDLSEDDTDPAAWGVNWPRQYDAYLRTAEATRTRFGGHGGSEALPEQKIERDPWLRRMFAGYAFSLDYRDRRGHAYMLADQEASGRLTRPQSGSCLHCHASLMPLYRELGDGDVNRGFEASYHYTYTELNGMLHASGHAQPVSCVDCHEPGTMMLRVTRPGFVEGIRALADSTAPLPHLPSVERWRESSRSEPYDPNTMASRNEMRSFVCGQCHVEYYCGSGMKLTFPWGNGLRAEQVEAFWDATELDDGTPFYDYTHAESGARVLKAQHPEFELWSQGIHARAGVSCSDCHMPYMREGAGKISDHWVRSPLLNVNRACQVCHAVPEAELVARAEAAQERNLALIQRAGQAILDQLDAIAAAREAGAADADLAEARRQQRKAQWRLDFIAAENSMGFHAPQEAARVLAEAVDHARQGQIAALELLRAADPGPRR